MRGTKHGAAEGHGIHLIVLIHGLYGNPDNLAVVKEEIERAGSSASTCPSPSVSDLKSASSSDRKGKGKGRAEAPKASKEEEDDYDVVEDILDLGDTKPGSKSTRLGLEVRVLVCKSFTGSHTWDGIDVNAHRASREIDQEIKRLEGQGKKVEVFSLMGYSLGGLVGRYLVGLLHARQPSFFDAHRPGSFSTFATPQIGTLKYGSRVNTLVHTVGKRLFSRSGRQLYRLDRDTIDGRAVLSVLADPDHIFLRALQLFPRIKVVVNGCNDLTVPYPTGSISLTDPFVDHESNHLDITIDDKGCIESYTLPQSTPPSIMDEESLRRRKERKEALERERHRVPPFVVLPLPGPLKHIAFLILPFVIPLALFYAFCTFMVHSWQSAKRTALHYAEQSPETIPLLTQPISSRSSTSTPPQASASPQPDHEQIVNRIPLLLDTEQVEMVQNLNTHLPQLERVITWWPWCWNTHAMLVVRSAKRFKYQEGGRKVVRHWAEWAIQSGEEAAEWE